MGTCYILLGMLATEPTALYMLHQHSTTEPPGPLASTLAETMKWHSHIWLQGVTKRASHHRESMADILHLSQSAHEEGQTPSVKLQLRLTHKLTDHVGQMACSLSLPTYVHIEVRDQPQELAKFFSHWPRAHPCCLASKPGDPLPSPQCWIICARYHIWLFTLVMRLSHWHSICFPDEALPQPPDGCH